MLTKLKVLAHLWKVLAQKTFRSSAERVSS